MRKRCRNEFGEIAYYIKPNKFLSERENQYLANNLETLQKAVTLEKLKCVKLNNSERFQKNPFAIDKLFKTNSNKLSVEEIKRIIIFLDSSYEQNLDLNRIPIDEIANFMFAVAKRYMENNSLEENKKIYSNEKEDLEINNQKKDTPIAKPEVRIENGRKIYIRNQDIKKAAIENSDFCCEYNKLHKYFISKRTNQNYVEGHHLIPMEFQDEFDFSLDVEANIVSLCVVCYKQLHHGIHSDKILILETLYEQRKKIVKMSNICDI
ncbi:hypothetical protein N752_12945 [Desulforamulus aquiferis]|nr:hypothetical protein [Desulforamulus aquiferis]RYD04827.1 hypothetical protein N752_12945 [Desulforamulus aquiferis]